MRTTIIREWYQHRNIPRTLFCRERRNILPTKKKNMTSHLPQKPWTFERTVSLLLFGIFLSGLMGCMPLSSFTYIEPTPFLLNHVVQETNLLTQIWYKDDIYISLGYKQMDAAMGVNCFVGGLGELRDQVTCLKSETGDVLWQQEPIPDGSLVATPVGIFVTSIGPSISFHSALRKYDIQNGKLIWEKTFNKENPISLTFFDNQVQVITWKPSRKLWVFDTDGNILKVINDTYAFLFTSEIIFTSETGVRAMDTDTNGILWEHVDTGLEQPPLVTLDKIFCRGNGSQLGTVYALDRKTGSLLWKVHNIVYGSGLAHSPEKKLVYVLRNDGNLLAINETTGEINIAATFSPAQFLLNIEGTSQVYELAYDQEQHILLVSLADSNQLFAFKEE